jgi:hypothetical protein
MMAKRDETTSLKVIDDLHYLEGISGIYVLYQILTGFIKVGSTRKLPKRFNAQNQISSPHVLMAFFPVNDPIKLEKEFHRNHRADQIETEYFNLDINYVIEWMELQNLKSSYTPSKEEMAFQIIRANWITTIINNGFIKFKDYLKTKIG